jgi:hypothetical protein
MNALTKIEPDTAFAAWLDQGRTFLAERRELDWKMADHLAQGIERFPDQVQLSFLGEQWAIDAKELRRSISVAASFPPALRAPDVPFEVHSQIASLPEDRRLETLKTAAEEHWGAKRAKAEVTLFRQHNAAFEDEDQETRLGVEILRAWNRAPAEAREYAWELIRVAARKGFASVNEDQISDA